MRKEGKMKHGIRWFYVGLVILGLSIPMVGNTASFFIVSGHVTDEENSPLNDLEVTVSNETKNLMLMQLTGDSGPGTYAATFIDFFGKSVADINDEIKVSVKQMGIVAAEETKRITQADLDKGFVNVDLKIIPRLKLDSISPDNALASGGSIVKILGENFQEGAAVTFGGIEASNVVVVSDTELSVTVPAGSRGAVNVMVTNLDGHSASIQFSYIDVPRLTSINPDNALASGGSTVKILGENFQEGVTVTFGGIEASNVVVVSDTELSVTVPAGTRGVVEVTVTNPDSLSASIQFTYIDVPRLTSIIPDSALASGGSTVQILGENFQEGVTVTFGGIEASNVVVVSDTELSVTVPAGSRGAVNVMVTNLDGHSASIQFSYIDVPRLTSINPDNALASGGSTVKILGENFQEGAAVTFGGIEASNVVVVSETELSVTVPAGTRGVVEVTVTNPDSLSASIQFTYIDVPRLTSIIPDSALASGGSTVQILGENFQEGVTVTFGGIEASNVVVVSETELSVTVPAGTRGVVEVIVTNPDSHSASIQFTYIDYPPWDVDKNGSVNIFDLVTVASQFGQSGQGLSGDIDRNGTVNIFDLVLVASHFGEATVATVPPLISLNSKDFGAPQHLSMRLTDRDAGMRTRVALTELENLSETDPSVLLPAKLLRQWLVTSGEIPSESMLLPNYPNPFNPETWIPYQLANSSNVSILIYSVLGQPVRHLEIGFRHAGRYVEHSQAAHWDGRNDAGELVTSGVYFYSIKANEFSAMRKMVIGK
jgi:hypothetical protein